jgi:hypothetical protein
MPKRLKTMLSSRDELVCFFDAYTALRGVGGGEEDNGGPVGLGRGRGGRAKGGRRGRGEGGRRGGGGRMRLEGEGVEGVDGDGQVDLERGSEGTGGERRRVEGGGQAGRKRAVGN